MTQQELDKAKDKDLAGSLIAMRRAVRMARTGCTYELQS